ncbi:MAG: hypothetical protein WCK51_06430 [Armatimonadota bacterium]
MSLLKKLFGTKPTPTPVNEMSYDDVWVEFRRIVPYRDGKMFISVLQQPEYKEALAWLSPGTECPMAKSLVRGLVDYFRNPTGDLDNLAMVYQAESVENWSTPPGSSLTALGQIVAITGIKATVFYKPTPEEEHVKIEITP